MLKIQYGKSQWVWRRVVGPLETVAICAASGLVMGIFWAWTLGNIRFALFTLSLCLTMPFFFITLERTHHDPEFTFRYNRVIASIFVGLFAVAIWADLLGNGGKINWEFAVLMAGGGTFFGWLSVSVIWGLIFTIRRRGKLRKMPTTGWDMLE